MEIIDSDSINAISFGYIEYDISCLGIAGFIYIFYILNIMIK
jgi:hypothetical protein